MITIDQAITRFSDEAVAYLRSSVSKSFYNKEASEADKIKSMECKQIAEWLKELKELKEASGGGEDG